MSDNWLSYVPADPTWQPSDEVAERAAKLLKTIVPAADEVKYELSDVQFIDAGANWSGVRCPYCHADLEGWWGDAMSDAFKNGPATLSVTTPCCKKPSSLNDLDYVWPVAFGRFVLSAQNPNVKNTTSEQDQSLEECLGTKLRKVWTHI